MSLKIRKEPGWRALRCRHGLPALFWKQDLLEKAKADTVEDASVGPNATIMNAIGLLGRRAERVSTRTRCHRRNAMRELVKVARRVGPVSLPGPYQPVRSVGEALRRANTATGGKKTVAPDSATLHMAGEGRYHTAELRCMVYLSLIHGANGIGYYSYSNVTGKKGTKHRKGTT
jgi:hypothetical protein